MLVTFRMCPLYTVNCTGQADVNVIPCNGHFDPLPADCLPALIDSVLMPRNSILIY